MRFLVDTNVFIDLMFEREEGFIDALKFFNWCNIKKNRTYITSMSFRDIEYVAMKKYHDRKKVRPILMDIYSICSKVIGISADSAINSIFENYKDFEDELMVQTAKEEMMDAIITNNIKDFKDKGIAVLTPKEAISMVV